MLEAAWWRERYVEAIIHEGRHAETGKEGHLVDTRGGEGDRAAGCRLSAAVGQRDEKGYLLAPANPTTLMRMPATYAAYPLHKKSFSTCLLGTDIKVDEALERTEGLRRTCSSTTRRCEGCTGPQHGNAPSERRSIL